MEGYADGRTLIVKDYYHPMYPDSLRAVAVYQLPWGAFGEIPQKVLDELRQSAIAGYDITERNSMMLMGAGSSTQLVLLELASGAMEGVAAALMAELTRWTVSKIRNRGKETTSHDESVDRATQLITEHFSPHGQLAVFETQFSDEDARVLLKDDCDNRFLVEIRGSLNITIARRLPGPDEPDFAEIDRGAIAHQD